jgi:hypothetical protein
MYWGVEADLLLRLVVEAVHDDTVSWMWRAVIR